MLKVKPHPDYPVEPGRYLRGNDFSPAAVAIILNKDEDKIPPDIELLVRAGFEAGAALSGTVQTPNIGFEKIICNIVANPNIRYLILSGPESEGHLTGEALKSLLQNGVDDKKRIVGSNALHAVLYNIPFEFVDRFRKQVTLIDLQFRGTEELIRQAVRATLQENPVEFEGYIVSDPGAFPEPPLGSKMKDRVLEPWKLPQNAGERAAVEKMKRLIENLKSRKKNKPE